jgi:hypothetical protein
MEKEQEVLGTQLSLPRWRKVMEFEEASHPASWGSKGSQTQLRKPLSRRGELDQEGAIGLAYGFGTITTF